jgi:hypothetical protein
VRNKVGLVELHISSIMSLLLKPFMPRCCVPPAVLMMQCMPASMAWRELSDLRLAKQSARHSSSSSSSTILSSACSRASSMASSPHHQTHHRSDSPPSMPAAIAEGGLYVHIPGMSSMEAGGQLQSPVSVSPASATSALHRPIATSSIVEVRQLLMWANEAVSVAGFVKCTTCPWTKGARNQYCDALPVAAVCADTSPAGAALP